MCYQRVEVHRGQLESLELLNKNLERDVGRMNERNRLLEEVSPSFLASASNSVHAPFIHVRCAIFTRGQQTWGLPLSLSPRRLIEELV